MQMYSVAFRLYRGSAIQDVGLAQIGAHVQVCHAATKVPYHDSHPEFLELPPSLGSVSIDRSGYRRRVRSFIIDIRTLQHMMCRGTDLPLFANRTASLQRINPRWAGDA